MKGSERGESSARPKANASNGKESENEDRSGWAADTRHPLKETPRASDEARRQTSKPSAKKKSSGKKTLLSFGDDIVEEEEGSSEFQVA